MEHGAPPEQVEIEVRRYRCRACTAILTVGPKGLVPRRWYGAGAIAGALAAYARGETTPSVRATTAPHGPTGPSAMERWITLVRWLDAIERGALFAIRDLVGLARRAVAEQATLVLAARAGRVLGEDLSRYAFMGASLAG